MIIAASANEVINSPIVVALFSVTATAFVALAAAALRLVVQLAQMKTVLIEVRATLTELKTDPDVMRWSNYGRAVQAFNPASPGQVIQP